MEALGQQLAAYSRINKEWSNLRIKRVLLVILVAILIYALNGYGSRESEGTTQSLSPQETASSAPSPSPSAKKVKITWADTTNYVFSVDVEIFDGDMVPAGDYYFHETTVQGTVPVIYDIYVSSNLYNKLEELKESELVGSVGGQEEAVLNTALLAGSYVYIKYNEVLGDQGSMLEIGQK